MLTNIRTQSARLLACGGLCFNLAAAPVALAGDFQPKRVAADAQWLAFVDVEGLVKSTLGKYLIEHGSEIGFDIDADELEDAEALTGIDLLKDIRSVTIYGQGNPEENPQFIALLETTAAVDDTIEQLKGAAAEAGDGEEGDITAIEIAGQKVHVMSDGNQTTYVNVRNGPNSDTRLVTICMNREWMAKGLAVLDGKTATLDHAEKPLVNASPVDGTLMFASCGDLSWIEMDEDDGPGSAIMQGTKGAEIAFGETGPESFFNARIVTASDEEAQNLSDMLRGVVAMARFAAKQEPSMQPLLEPTKSLKLKTEGVSINLSMKHSTQGLIDAMKAALASESNDDDNDDADEVEIKVKVGAGDSKDNDDDNDDPD